MLCQDREVCIFDVFKDFTLRCNRLEIVNKPIMEYKVICSQHELPFKFSAMFSAQPPKYKKLYWWGVSSCTVECSGCWLDERHLSALPLAQMYPTGPTGRNKSCEAHLSEWCCGVLYTSVHIIQNHWNSHIQLVRSRTCTWKSLSFKFPVTINIVHITYH